MGCKPSKESQVATGVHTTSNLQKKKSDASKNFKTEEIRSTVTPLPTAKANDVTTTNDANVKTVKDQDGNEEKKEEEVREEGGFEGERVEEIRDVRVMDVQENNKEEESEKRRNVIAPDSPDLFFSTRKEEVPLDILAVPLVEKSEADNMPENDVVVDKPKVDDLERKEEKEANDVKDMKNVKGNDDIDERKEEVKEEKGLGRERIEEIKNVNVRNAQEKNNNKEETEEKRNFIAPDSPDQFFSTRKDEVPVEILTLPLAGTLEVDDLPENNFLVEEVKVEDQDIKEENEGKPNCVKESADPKETLLFKEEQ